ncbi:hypothetical protein NEOLI_002885 [Neolecta irregularis DAH-3]|uniref:Protein RCR2 n=1 Tax=Neolecta irregularis (strain DAH-3) TaxID=1198029 RepID=A0A1U7LJG4_NEOID|nr:hypothetical protein NEOLI_002885 [Neolecta irregularis DAH-3]|eukprot:OLL22733.1 hypothetical protein NEOLI_002885 [Neolecta irregularis DAH-3]
MAETLVKRYWSYVDDGSYWIRSLVIVMLLCIVGLAIVASYTHANRRIRQGQPPLPYHSWLVAKKYRGLVYPAPQPNYQFNTFDPNATYGRPNQNGPTLEQELPPYSGQQLPVYEPPKAHLYPHSTGNTGRFQSPMS